LTTAELELKAQRDLEARQTINREIARLLQNVPGRSEQAGLEMFMQILSATTLDELDRPWNGNGMGDYIDKRIRIDSIRQEPSSFKDGPGVFLVASGMDYSTGAVISFMTSSVYEMAQLLVAHDNKLLPADFVPRVAVKPTENGYYPRHLEVYREGYSALSTEPTRPPRPEDAPGYKPGDNLRRMQQQAAAKRETTPNGAGTPDDEPGF
jgi:hypothetical protein